MQKWLHGLKGHIVWSRNEVFIDIFDDEHIRLLTLNIKYYMRAFNKITLDVRYNSILEKSLQGMENTLLDTLRNCIQGI